MFLFTTFGLSLALSAAIAASATGTAPPPASEQFAILANFTTAGVAQTYNFYAVQNDTRVNSVVLVGQPCTPRGCNASNPYFFNGNATDAALNINLSHYPNLKMEGIYGVIVPKVGGTSGVVKAVTGVLDKQEFTWSYDGSGKISHRVQTPLDGFWLCTDNVKGNSSTVLKWGQANRNGSAPGGCQGPVGLRKAQG